MTIRKAALIGLLALLSVPAVAHAREAPEGARDQQVTLYELVLRDGSRMYGTIDQEDDTAIVF